MKEKGFIKCLILIIGLSILWISLPADTLSQNKKPIDLPPTKEAEKALEELKKKFGDKEYLFKAFSFIAHSAKADQKGFDRINTFLSTFIERTEKIFTHKPTYAIKVISFQKSEDFYKFSGVGRGVLGYYNPSTYTFVNQTAAGLGNAAHEFCHALFYADWEEKKPNEWFVEGLSSLFENCLRTPEGEFRGIGLSNFRLLGLRKSIEKGSSAPLKNVMSGSGGDPYAYGRGILTYLFYKGLLEKYYRTFKSEFSNDPSGIKALENVTGKELKEFENEWKDWIKQIDVEARTINDPVIPVLGIISKIEKNSTGLLIAGISPNAPAEQSGLKEGDRIISVDGKSVSSMEKLLKILKEKKIKDKANLKFQRNNENKEVTVTLDVCIEG